MLTRRRFLGAGAGALGAVLAGEAGAGARARLGRIGAQLYTVRRELEKDFRGTLGRVAAIGFREVEFAGTFGRTPAQVREAVREAGLTAPSGHVQFVDLRDRMDATLDGVAAAGHRYVVLAWLPPEERAALDQYRALADLLGRAGEAARRRGLVFAYHNHDYEFAALDGTVPYDLLIGRTDPKLVALELDLYWIVKGGRDPLEYFAKQPGRFRLLHVKDMAPGPGRGFADVGRGTIDFPRIFRAARAAGVEHYFVEHDEPPGSPFDSLKASFDYLRRLRY